MSTSGKIFRLTCFNEAKNVGAIKENEQNIKHLADISLFGPQNRIKSCSV